MFDESPFDTGSQVSGCGATPFWSHNVQLERWVPIPKVSNLLGTLHQELAAMMKQLAGCSAASVARSNGSAYQLAHAGEMPRGDHGAHTVSKLSQAVSTDCWV